MDLIIAGPGRAGGALARRFCDGGHHLVGLLARDLDSASETADWLGAELLDWTSQLPPADLLVVAVHDDAIGPVAAHLAPLAAAVSSTVHVSGSVPVSALAPFSAHGPIGSFHPLQTLPTAEIGSARLGGAWVAVTSEDDLLADGLFRLAVSIGMKPFELLDDAKALYHAAAAASANYPLAALAMAERLFEAAGVPFEAARPLVEAVVANAFDIGPKAALTGPIARGDVGTVVAQRAAVAAAVPDLEGDFVALGRAVARTAGTAGQFRDVLDENG